MLDLLASLVQKSLVVYEEDAQGQGRYRLLETVRQYGRDRLLGSGEAAAVREQHRDWFLVLAEEAEPGLRGAATRSDLGEEAFADAWAAGRAMRLEDAIQLALTEGQRPDRQSAYSSWRFVQAEE